MKIVSRLGYVLILFAALSPFFLAGCGKKGPVRPLAEVSPVAPPAFSTIQTGETLLLSWNLPDLNQDGSPLTDLAGFRIYRLGFEPGDPCPECREQDAALVAELDLDYLPASARIGQRLFWFDTRVAAERGYLYRILGVNRKGRPGAVARTQQILLPPPAAPAQIEASGHDLLVRLRWNDVDELPPEARLLGYHVYRRGGEAPFPPLPLTDQPLSLTDYEDFTVVNDQPYGYTVRTLIERDGRQIFSSRSPEVLVTPVAGR